MYDIFKPRFLQSSFPPRILVGVGGSSTTTVDTVAREAAEAAQQSVDAITAQVGEVISPNQGVISSDGLQFENKTGLAITLTGTSAAELLFDGLNAIAGSLEAGSVTSLELADAAVTNSKLADMAALTVKGNNSGVSGAPVDLSGADVIGLLPVASNTANGLMSSADKVKSHLIGFRFSNVSQMIAETSLAVGDRIAVRGYYQDNDGGGNVFEVVAAGTGADDGGAFLNLTGSGLQAKGLFPEGHRLEHWGVVKDGVSDDAAKISAAVDWCFANDVKSLKTSQSNGSYAIAGNIQLKKNVHLDFGYNTMVPLTDDAGFTLAQYGAVENLYWDAGSRPTWRGPLLLANNTTDSSITSYPRIRNVTCVGYKDTVNSLVNGVMISLDATAGTRVTGIRASGLYAGNLECAVEFKPSANTLSGWVNSNHLEFDMIYNCNKCFSMSRLDSELAIDNNYIKATYQTGPTAQSPVLTCDGAMNEFDLLIWDWDINNDKVAIDLGQRSEQNLVRGSFNPLSVKDASSSVKRNQIESRTFNVAPFSQYALEPSSTSSGVFMGQVDNTLAYAHSRYSVTAPAVSAGSINSIFTPNQNSRAVWNNVTSLAIEIDLLAARTAIRTIGVLFADDFVPDWVLFESSADGITWQELENLPGSRATSWSSRSFIGGSFQYLRITITSSVAKNFAVSQIFAWWKGEDQGAYLPTGGGDVYGDTKLHGGKSVQFTSSNGSGFGGLSVDNSNRLAIDATGGVKLNGTRILGDQQPAVADPVGGSVVDTECRAALIALADRIRNHGLIGL